MHIEEEIDQRALQLRAQAPVEREAGAGQLGGAFQIEDAERLSQLPVRLGCEVEFRRLAPAPYFLVVIGRAAYWDTRVRHVGNPDQQPA